MNKTKLALYFAASVVAILLLMFIWFFNSNYSVLGISDVKMMIEDNKSPAITIPATKEQYFNKWQCFDVKTIEISEAEIDYNEKRIVPYIQVNSNKRSLQFNVDPVINWDKKVVINKWKELANNQKSICLFAAYLQTDPDGTSIWYIDRIKTKAGYWDIANSSMGAQVLLR